MISVVNCIKASFILTLDIYRDSRDSNPISCTFECNEKKLKKRSTYYKKIESYRNKRSTNDYRVEVSYFV